MSANDFVIPRPEEWHYVFSELKALRVIERAEVQLFGSVQPDTQHRIDCATALVEALLAIDDAKAAAEVRS